MAKWYNYEVSNFILFQGAKVAKFELFKGLATKGKEQVEWIRDFLTAPLETPAIVNFSGRNPFHSKR